MPPQECGHAAPCPPHRLHRTWQLRAGLLRTSRLLSAFEPGMLDVDPWPISTARHGSTDKGLGCFGCPAASCGWCLSMRQRLRRRLPALRRATSAAHKQHTTGLQRSGMACMCQGHPRTCIMTSTDLLGRILGASSVGCALTRLVQHQWLGRASRALLSAVCPTLQSYARL